MERPGEIRVFLFACRMNWLIFRNEKYSVTLMWVESISGTERIFYIGRG